MPEPALQIDLNGLKTEVAEYLGWPIPVAPATWDPAVEAKIGRVIVRGLRQFYFGPHVLGKQTVTHSWSFLRPVTTLLTAVGIYQYELPNTVAQVEGDFTFATDYLGVHIRKIDEQEIRDLRQGDTTTGPPEVWAAVGKTADLVGTSGPRLYVQFWPTPDAIYTLGYRYLLVPPKMGDPVALIYPACGPEHAETLLESCLAIADRAYNSGRDGHWQTYLMLLASSVELDKKVTAPDWIGAAKRVGPTQRHDGIPSEFRNGLFWH